MSSAAKPEKKSYSFYFNANDWLGSQSVKLMSKAERGVYIHLLAIAWGSKQPGTLPASEDQVRRLAECTVAEWAEMGAAILAMFPLSECQTYRYNERLLVEADKEKGKSERAAKSANARWKCENDATASKNDANASNTDAVAMPAQCASDAQEQEQVKSIIPPDAGPASPSPAGVGGLPKAEPCPLTAQPGGKAQPGKRAGRADEDGVLGFAAFWDRYHAGGLEKRGSRKVAAGRWAGLSEKTRAHILAGLDVYRGQATANGPQFLPYAEKFLNPNRAEWANEGYGVGPKLPEARPAPAPMPADPMSLWGPTTAPPVVAPPASQYTGTIH